MFRERQRLINEGICPDKGVEDKTSKLPSSSNMEIQPKETMYTNVK